MPDEGIKDLDDWKRLWDEPGAKIKDEYDCEIGQNEMLYVITDRSWKEPLTEERAKRQGYASLKAFLDMNHAERGPNNLLRHRLDPDHCIGHGAGTWDLIPREFS